MIKVLFLSSLDYSVLLVRGLALEGITIKAAVTLCYLVLQKRSRNSKEKHHVHCLERCLQLWGESNLHELER